MAEDRGLIKYYDDASSGKEAAVGDTKKVETRR